MGSPIRKEHGEDRKFFRVRGGFHIRRENIQLWGELMEEAASKCPDGSDSVTVRKCALKLMRPKSSRYHNLLDPAEWNDRVAADRYRLERIRYHFRAIEISEGKKEFHIVPRGETTIYAAGEYKPQIIVKEDGDRFAALIERYTRQLIGAAREIRAMGAHKRKGQEHWREIIQILEDNGLQDW